MFRCYAETLCGHGLHEVVLHVALEVEVGKLVTLVDLEKSGKLGIRVNLTTIALVLKRVGSDVLVDLLANRSASHLSANLLSEELGKLIADASGLDETRRLAVSRSTSLLGRGLLGILHLTKNGTLKVLELNLEGRNDAIKLLDLAAELGHSRNRVRYLGNRSCDCLGGNGGSNLSDGSSLSLWLLGTRGLCSGGRS